MATVSIILVLFITAVPIIGGGTLVYYLIYRHIINKRLEQGVTHKKGLMSPLWMPVILIAVMLFLGAPVLMLIVFSALTFNTITGSEVVETHVSMDMGLYTMEEMQEGYLSVYSIEGNEGFTEEKVITGDLHYTGFVAEDAFSSWHPQFLVYAEVTEEYPEDAIYLFTVSLFGEEKLLAQAEQSVSQKEMPVCVISGMPEDAMVQNYELQVECAILDASAEEHLDMYFTEGTPLPAEYVIGGGSATFRQENVQ